MIFGRGRCPAVICGLILGVPNLASADALVFDIPAQPLPSALKAFAAQAHVQLLYVYSVVASGRSNAVRGNLETREALDVLLRGSGFEAAYASDTEVTIRRSSATRAQSQSNIAPSLRDDL
jgi:iron complex outermembrane receptor protein